MNTVVWLMVSMVHSGYAYGPEFKTQENCEVAAKHIQQTMTKAHNWTYTLPTCIRIEK